MTEYLKVEDKFLIANGLTISVESLEPFQKFDLKLQAKDGIGRLWEHLQQFQADENGTAKINSQEQFLIEQLSMNHPSTPYPPFFFTAGTDDIVLKTTLLTDEVIIAEREILMQLKNKSTTVETIQAAFTGKYFKVKKSLGTIIILGGSSGGYFWSDQVSGLLNSLGYNTLIINYFDRQDEMLPDELVSIDLDCLQNAYDWVKERYGIEDSIHLMGISKGAEMGLLFAAESDCCFNSMITFVPSSHVYEGISFRGHPEKSSWVYQNREFPFLPYPADKPFTMSMTAEELREIHDIALETATTETLERARIKAENISCPVLLISGTKDNTWNSEEMSQNILKRMKGNGHESKSKHINFKQMGHTFFLPNFPPILDNSSVSIMDASRANRESWEETLQFLAANNNGRKI